MRRLEYLYACPPIMSLFKMLSKTCLVELLSALTRIANSQENEPGSVLCSSENTGTDHGVHITTLPAINQCQTLCEGYTFAVIQGLGCWCSNDRPSNTTDNSQCSDVCLSPTGPIPCGNADQGLYTYLLIPSPY